MKRYLIAYTNGGGDKVWSATTPLSGLTSGVWWKAYPTEDGPGKDDKPVMIRAESIMAFQEVS